MEKVDQLIKESIPMGFNNNETKQRDLGRKPLGFFDTVMDEGWGIEAYHNKKFGTFIDPPAFDYRWFVDRCNTVGSDAHKVQKSIGSLGGGRHDCLQAN